MGPGDVFRGLLLSGNVFSWRTAISRAAEGGELRQALGRERRFPNHPQLEYSLQLYLSLQTIPSGSYYHYHHPHFAEEKGRLRHKIMCPGALRQSPGPLLVPTAATCCNKIGKSLKSYSSSRVPGSRNGG